MLYFLSSCFSSSSICRMNYCSLILLRRQGGGVNVTQVDVIIWESPNVTFSTVYKQPSHQPAVSARVESNSSDCKKHCTRTCLQQTWTLESMNHVSECLFGKVLVEKTCCEDIKTTNLGRFWCSNRSFWALVHCRSSLTRRFRLSWDSQCFLQIHSNSIQETQLWLIRLHWQKGKNFIWLKFYNNVHKSS